MDEKQKVVLALSGGLDSTTLLAHLLHEGAEVHGVGFQYGSKHNEYERQAMVKVAAWCRVRYTLIDVTTIFQPFKSDLLKSGGPIPEGHYEAENMKQTVVPARNLIFASILAGFAESIKAPLIALGVHAGDHTIYPDCRPKFIYSLRQAVEHATDGHVTVWAPFLYESKTSIVTKGLKLGVRYELTRTCYKDQVVACGRCGSCTERKEAFAQNHTTDPISYEYEE